MSAQILVVKPGSLSEPDRELLRSAGVVCVEAEDPDSVRLILPQGPALGGDELLYAAMRAIRAHGDRSTKSEFSDIVAELIEHHFHQKKRRGDAADPTRESAHPEGVHP